MLKIISTQLVRRVGFLVFYLLFFLINYPIHAALVAGDIVVIGMSGDISPEGSSGKRFSWVPLINLAAGTQIHFTDSGWLDTAFRAQEGGATYTVPATGITAGTIITAAGTTDETWNDNPNWNAPINHGGVGNNGMNFSTSGDQILVFTGTADYPQFLFALNGASTQFSLPANADDSNRTALPPGLIQGVNAVAVGAGSGDEDEFDNVWYTGPTTGTKTTLLAAVTDASNWNGSQDQYSPITTHFTVNPDSSTPPPDPPTLPSIPPVDTTTACGEPATLISAIQGSGAKSPKEGKIHTIEGVVVGPFQGSHQLNGFFVQEEDNDNDSDPMTSEGIFVYDNDFGVEVALEQMVRVTGQVDEYKNLTTLTNLTQVDICTGTAAVTAAIIYLPFMSDDYLERYEGMRVYLPQTLTVTDTYHLGAYGKIVVSNGRLMIPTHIAHPGTAAQVLQTQNDLNRLIIDDGSLQSHPPTIVYPPPGLSASHTLRNSYTVAGIEGVLEYRFGQYSVQPTVLPQFVATHPRTTTPASVGGTLKIASFNVLNYFNGEGNGEGFPTSRGAATVSEFNRQRDKIIQAIMTIDADIVGLMELENDGYGANSAIQDLVNGLNTVAGMDRYALIDPNLAQLGTQEIAVGFIYQPQTVTPVGAAVTHNVGAFASRNRQPLVQTFVENASGERLTIAVNHFKSKGCRYAKDDEGDQGDGQSCWNPTRVQAAQELATWLATDPTDSGDADFLIIGDLNAYVQEDPITALKNTGYIHLIEQWVGSSAYSYVFKGQAGYLDHALATPSLAAQVTGVTDWHINADEPRVLDYKETNKSIEQLTDLYQVDPYRASDHDPIIIGLDLGPMDQAPATPTHPTLDLSMLLTLIKELLSWNGNVIINADITIDNHFLLGNSALPFALNNFPVTDLAGFRFDQKPYLTTSRDLIIALPSLGTTTFNKQGETIPSATFLTGGISVNGAQFQQTGISHLSDWIDIRGNIFVDMKQTEQPAEIVVYATYVPLQSPMNEPLYFMLDQAGQLLRWDRDITHLEAFRTPVMLTPIVPIEMFSGQLFTPGQVKISFGYRLETGMVVLSSETLDLTVTE